MSLGSRIKEYRTRRGLTQNQMAEKLGMTEANFSNYERDKSSPPSEKLNQIADILNVSADYLLGRTDDPTPPESKPQDEMFNFDEDVRIIARGAQKLGSENRDMLKDMIKMMQQRAREAQDKE